MWACGLKRPQFAMVARSLLHSHANRSAPPPLFRNQPWSSRLRAFTSGDGAAQHPTMTVPRHTPGTKPLFTAVVKGNPDTNQLLDCPFSHRVLLTLEAKGIPYDMEFVDTSQPSRPQWLQEVNNGKVPVLKERDELLEKDNYIADSDRIVQVLEDRFPEPSMKSSAPEGIPPGPKVLQAFYQFLKCKPEEDDAKRQALLEVLKPFNDYLAQPGKGPLFGGKAMDATDASFAPLLYHLTVALPHFKSFDLPSELHALWRYLAYVQLLEAWQRTDYGTAAIIEGWARHP